MSDGLESPVRRKLLISGAASIGAYLLSGCHHPFSTPLPICSTAPSIQPSPETNLATNLLIDTHAHIFNGTDLQVKRFLDCCADSGLPAELVALAAEIIQELSWSLAPKASEEFQELAKLTACADAGTFQRRIEAHRTTAFNRARHALLQTKAMRDYKEQKTTGKVKPGQRQFNSEEIRHMDRMDELLSANSLTEYRAKKLVRQREIESTTTPCRVSAQKGGADEIFDFIKQGFQYRFVSVQDYLDSYQASDSAARRTETRRIDLMIANLVDYDWPLAQGCGTKSSLRDQMRVMERISIVTHGRIHGFLPYDPFRQVAMKAGKRPEVHCDFSDKESNLTLEEIADAIENHGFIGVKLYPPMGFKPIGNGDPTMPGNTWQGNLPEWMNSDVFYSSDGLTKPFGQRLDDELKSLYAWASEKQVPITAHADPTNGPKDEFKKFALAEGWKEALKSYPGLRINFGHIGDISGSLTSSGNNSIPSNSQEFVNLFHNDKGADGEFAYGDLSYAAGVLTDECDLKSRLLDLFKQSAANGTPNPYERLMYGTDWYLLIRESGYTSYLAKFRQLMQEIDKELPAEPLISQRFFALNAVRWLGLLPGDCTRKRLERFYTNNQIDLDHNPPDWITKIRAVSVK